MDRINVTVSVEIFDLAELGEHKFRQLFFFIAPRNLSFPALLV
jgi:hypothetical protein